MTFLHTSNEKGLHQNLLSASRLFCPTAQYLHYEAHWTTYYNQCLTKCARECYPYFYLPNKFENILNILNVWGFLPGITQLSLNQMNFHVSKKELLSCYLGPSKNPVLGEDNIMQVAFKQVIVKNAIRNMPNRWELIWDYHLRTTVFFTA